MKAIETVYNGYRFRSRLEARWAVFFKSIGFEYRYEPEGFDLDGVWYLPDFYLFNQDCLVEVKPTTPTREEREKALKLCLSLRKQVFLFSGDVWKDVKIHAFFPINSELTRDKLTNSPKRPVFWLSTSECILLHTDDNEPYGMDFVNRTAWAFGVWTQCDNCKKIGLFTPFYAYCPCKGPWDSESPRLMAAYTAARQARFEHGEVPG